MKLPPEFDDERPGEGMRGLVLAIVGSLIFYAVIAAFIFAITGCVSRLYEQGQLTAEIRGDYEYRRSSDGSVAISLRHTPVIQASGTAVSKATGALGSAATAIALTH